jgi:hypothetical protein
MHNSVGSPLLSLPKVLVKASGVWIPGTIPLTSGLIQPGQSASGQQQSNQNSSSRDKSNIEQQEIVSESLESSWIPRECIEGNDNAGKIWH